MAKGAQLVTAQQNPAAATTKLALPTPFAIQVPPVNKTEKTAFENAHRSGSVNHRNGTEGRNRFATTSHRGSSLSFLPPNARRRDDDEDVGCGAEDGTSSSLLTSGGTTIETASETTECHSMARVPARVAASRTTSDAVASSAPGAAPASDLT